jgi:hypothetical protein
MAHKRDVAALKRVIEQLGDMLLSEAIERLDAGPGAPQRWDFDHLFDLYLDIELAKDRRGIRAAQACREIAKRLGLRWKTIQKLHTRAHQMYSPMYAKHPNVLREWLREHEERAAGNPTI